MLRSHGVDAGVRPPHPPASLTVMRVVTLCIMLSQVTPLPNPLFERYRSPRHPGDREDQRAKQQYRKERV